MFLNGDGWEVNGDDEEVMGTGIISSWIASLGDVKSFRKKN